MAYAGVGASQPMSGDGTVAQSPSGSPLTMKLYVRVFMSHAAAIMRPHAPFLTTYIHLGPRRPSYVPGIPRRSTVSGPLSSSSGTFVSALRIQKLAGRHDDRGPCQ